MSKKLLIEIFEAALVVQKQEQKDQKQYEEEDNEKLKKKQKEEEEEEQKEERYSHRPLRAFSSPVSTECLEAQRMAGLQRHAIKNRNRQQS